MTKKEIKSLNQLLNRMNKTMAYGDCATSLRLYVINGIRIWLSKQKIK